jgi:hypothetical protein
MAQTSNIDQVVSWLENWVNSYDFTRPSKDQSLGRDIATKVVEGIERRSSDQNQGATTVWPPNAPTYAASKQKRYGWSHPNYRTGQMLSKASLFGRTTIAPQEVTMRYGTDTPPSGSAAPSGYISDHDRYVTDTEKASFPHSGQSRRQVKRPFYELDDEITRQVLDVCRENLDSYIWETNQRNGV